MKKILFTGFEPFGGETMNPSWEAVKQLPETTEHAVLYKRRMPVEYDTVADLIKAAIEEIRPDAVICVGQAGGRAVLTPEVAALNIKDASIADNAGVLFSGEAVKEDGPAAYFATVPVKMMTAAMKSAGVPASVSYTAGTYVCNNIMYHLLDILDREYPRIKGGFIHIPFECSQAARHASPAASLPLDIMVKGLEAAAEAAAEAMEKNLTDVKKASGNTH